MPSTTSGLKPKRPLVPGTGKCHASSSFATFDLLICFEGGILHAVGGAAVIGPGGVGAFGRARPRRERRKQCEYHFFGKANT